MSYDAWGKCLHGLCTVQTWQRSCKLLSAGDSSAPGVPLSVSTSLFRVIT